jgi:TatD DNase family protein
MEEQNDFIFEDAILRQKRKHGKWRPVASPFARFESYPQLRIADTHAHLQMLTNPALALARAGAHRVTFVETMLDPAGDGLTTFSEFDTWLQEARAYLQAIVQTHGFGVCDPQALPEETCTELARLNLAAQEVPLVRISPGVHPHNAKDYTPEMDDTMRRCIRDPRVSALGEIGLDYHYDLSPRPVQREVFRTQLRIALEVGLPVVLHMREAHDDGFRILEEEGFPAAGTLLHCFNLDAHEVARWVEAGCYIAFGGPVTFKKADEVREAAAAVPLDKLLSETDAPFMTPEPLRGIECEPAYTIFSAEELCRVRGAHTESEKTALLDQLYTNAMGLLNRPPLESQKEVLHA